MNSTAWGLASEPRATTVLGSATTRPDPSKPMSAMNRPMPAVIPIFRFFGTSLTSASLNLHSVSTMKIKPSHSTAARATSQGFWTPASARGMHTEYAKKAFRPMPLAKAMG